MTRADSDGTTTMQDGVVIELTGRGDDGRPDNGVPTPSGTSDAGAAARSTGGSKPKTSVKRAFLRLLRTNKAYRLLWLSGFISQMGDWFNDIAVFVLLQRISGTSSMPVVSVFLARMIPFTFLGPVVGWMADRFDRLTLMLICDLARAALILVLTVLDDSVSLPFLLLVKLLASALAAQFDPCRSAVMPVIVSDPDELVVANAMDGTMYTITQFTGSAIGGLFTAWFGTRANFAVDTLSYLGSALCVLGVQAAASASAAGYTKVGGSGPDEEAPAQDAVAAATSGEGGRVTGQPGGEAVQVGAGDGASSAATGAAAQKKDGLCASVAGGVSYLCEHKDLLWVTLFKALDNVPMAGAEVAIVAVVERGYPISTSLGVGIVMGAEALGNLITPFVLPCTGSNPRRMKLALAASYVVTTAGFALYTVGPWLGGFGGYGVNVGGALLAGIGWALQYVYTVSILQLGTPDAVRGRVFAFSLAVRTGISMPALLFFGWLLDSAGYSPSQAMAVAVAINCVLGVLFGCYYAKYKNVGATDVGVDSDASTSSGSTAATDDVAAHAVDRDHDNASGTGAPGLAAGDSDTRALIPPVHVT